MKLKNLFDTLPKKISFVIASIVSVATFIYFDPFKLFEDEEEKEEITNINNNSSLNNNLKGKNDPDLDLSELEKLGIPNLENIKIKLVSLYKQIEKEKVNNLINIETLMVYNEYVYYILKFIIGDTYIVSKELKLNNINDPKKYGEIFFKYEIIETEEKFESANKILLKILNIDENLFQLSFQTAMQKHQDLIIFHLQKIQKIKQESLLKNKAPVKLTIEEVEKFMRFAIDNTNKYDNSLFNEDPGVAIQIKQQYLMDLASIENNFNFEDIMTNVEIVRSPKFMALAQELQSKFMPMY